MTDELITRLRQYSKPGRGDTHPQAVACREAADRIEALTAERDRMAMSCLSADGEAQRAWDAQKAAEAERDRLRYERDAILLDGTVHSDQREKYERLCARIAAGKASQQDAVDAIRQLCRDNERLALRRSDARAALKGESHD